MSKRRINVRGLVWRDGKILAVKHRNDDGSESPYWALPGGGLDPMEDLRSGVKRELMEETGVSATVGNLLYVQQFRSERDNFEEELEFFFHVEDSPAFSSVQLESTSHGAAEIAQIKFVNPKEVPMQPNILSKLDIEASIQHGYPITIENNL